MSSTSFFNYLASANKILFQKRVHNYCTLYTIYLVHIAGEQSCRIILHTNLTSLLNFMHASSFTISVCKTTLIFSFSLYRTQPIFMILFHYIILKCTVASKFLLLQESTRDPTDLYLSLRYPPLVFVCDTPCGVVRHMDCRNPEITKELWGNFAGCFEKPLLRSYQIR